MVLVFLFLFATFAAIGKSWKVVKRLTSRSMLTQNTGKSPYSLKNCLPVPSGMGNSSV